ncbi:MAG: thiosulfate sulfurtransferase GlpE [Oceanospirillaceae bacterium]
MSDFQCINCEEAQKLLSQGAILLDIRDQDSFHQGHPSQAKNLNNDNIQALLQPLAKDHNILVLCYHGISSKSAAQFIHSQGYTNTASIDGGFSAWQALFPDDIHQGI